MCQRWTAPRIAILPGAPPHIDPPANNGDAGDPSGDIRNEKVAIVNDGTTPRSGPRYTSRYRSMSHRGLLFLS